MNRVVNARPLITLITVGSKFSGKRPSRKDRTLPRKGKKKKKWKKEEEKRGTRSRVYTAGEVLGGSKHAADWLQTATQQILESLLCED